MLQKKVLGHSRSEGSEDDKFEEETSDVSTQLSMIVTMMRLTWMAMKSLTRKVRRGSKLCVLASLHFNSPGRDLAGLGRT